MAARRKFIINQSKYDAGLEVRREVLGAEYIDKSIVNAKISGAFG
jgi:hypothetical protein